MYKLTTFDGLTLPVASPKHTGGTAGTVAGMVAVVGGGMYDALGASKALPALPYELRYDCKVQQATAALQQAALDALRAKRGVLGTLTRRPGDGSDQTAQARLLAVEYETDAHNTHGKVQGVTLRWQVRTLWRSALQQPEHTLSSTTMALSVTNSGNAPAEDVVLTYTAGGSNCTGLTLVCGSHHLVYAGTVVAGKALVIDCGARSVRNDGSDDYARLTLGANHASGAWMRLEAGANTLTVTRTGGGTGSVLKVGYYHTWE